MDKQHDMVNTPLCQKHVNSEEQC